MSENDTNTDETRTDGGSPGIVAESMKIIPVKNEAMARFRTVSWGHVGNASTSRSM